MLTRALNEITLADLQALIDNQAPESRRLEYKRDLWPRNKDGNKEFLKDISAFANSQGGDLIVGIEEVEGQPNALVGIEVDDTGAETLVLEERLQSGLEPRLSGVRPRWLTLENGKHILIIRVPDSLSGPHRILSTSQFYARRNGGAYPMDTHELRDAFIGGERLHERLRAIHHADQNISHRQELPFAVSSDPSAVISVIPLDIFRGARDLDITVEESVVPPIPQGNSGASWNIILEGVLWSVGQSPHPAFALTHRQGRFDGFWTIGGMREVAKNEKMLLAFPDSFKNGLYSNAFGAQTRLRQYGVYGPWLVMVSLVNIKGSQIPRDTQTLDIEPPLRRTTAYLGEIMTETITEDTLQPLLSAFQRTYGRLKR
ncbi:ATP-binding protein (plasmid) [Acetobacter sp. AC2005]|uniref:AlbA family DNA-binding domain-containing protein n=1 Tax=Acetobacter sp. AC2005 TaxID=3134142 RepID=UPI0030CB3E07